MPNLNMGENPMCETIENSVVETTPKDGGIYWIKVRERHLTSEPEEGIPRWRVGRYMTQSDCNWWEVLGDDVELTPSVVDEIGPELTPPEEDPNGK